MGKSKLIPFIAIGAVAGAVISMFDKTTRQHTVDTTKAMKEKVTYYADNQDELLGLVETKVAQAQSFYSNASENVMGLVSQAEDAKTLPATIQSLVTETIEAFSKK